MGYQQDGENDVHLHNMGDDELMQSVGREIGI